MEQHLYMLDNARQEIHVLGASVGGGGHQLTMVIEYRSHLFINQVNIFLIYSLSGVETHSCLDILNLHLPAKACGMQNFLKGYIPAYCRNMASNQMFQPVVILETYTVTC